MKFIFFTFFAAFILLSCNQVSELEKWLIKEDFSYYKDDEGDFCITLSIENRSQNVWIYGESHLSGKNEIRELFSPSFISSSTGQTFIQQQLMMDNYENSLWGFWGMTSSDDDLLYLYQIQLNEKTKFLYLRDAISTCALQADKLEEQLSDGLDLF